MLRIVRRMGWMLAVAAAVWAGSPSPAQAVLVTTGSGIVLFDDDFESAPVVVNGGTSDADPVATVGRWAVSEGQMQQCQVVNTAVPGSYQGENYLGIFRSAGGSYTDVNAVFASAVDAGTLDISWAINVSSESESRQLLGYFKVQGASGDQRVRMFLSYTADSQVTLFTEDAAGTDFNTGLTFAMDEWVCFGLSLDLDGQNYSLTLTDGSGSVSTATAIPFHTSGADAVSFRYAASPTGSVTYFDAADAAPCVPEPSALGLGLLGLGLCYGAWIDKRRRVEE